MQNLTLKTKMQTAVQLVIIDAIEKGDTYTAADLIEYIRSEAFEKAVNNYIELMNETSK